MSGFCAHSLLLLLKLSFRSFPCIDSNAYRNNIMTLMAYARKFPRYVKRIKWILVMPRVIIFQVENFHCSIRLQWTCWIDKKYYLTIGPETSSQHLVYCVKLPFSSAFIRAFNFACILSLLTFFKLQINLASVLANIYHYVILVMSNV